MGVLIPFRRRPPETFEVAGLLIAEVDGEWWGFRPGSKAWQRRTRTYWRPVVGPCESREDAERRARRFALKPLRDTEEHHA